MTLLLIQYKLLICKHLFGSVSEWCTMKFYNEISRTIQTLAIGHDIKCANVCACVPVHVLKEPKLSSWLLYVKLLLALVWLSVDERQVHDEI